MIASGLRVVQRLNDEVIQDGNTRDMIFGVAEIFAAVSQVVSLEPGDLILTGTPAGIGFSREPKIALQPGDTVEVEVESVGRLSNPVTSE